MAKAFGVISKPSFSQSTVVIAALGATWVLWLAANNKLLTYWAILTGQANPQTGSGTVGGTSTGVVQGVTGTPGASVSATVTPTGNASSTPYTGGLF